MKPFVALGLTLTAVLFAGSAGAQTTPAAAAPASVHLSFFAVAGHSPKITTALCETAPTASGEPAPVTCGHPFVSKAVYLGDLEMRGDTPMISSLAVAKCGRPTAKIVKTAPAEWEVRLTTKAGEKTIPLHKMAFNATVIKGVGPFTTCAAGAEDLLMISEFE